jgi:hypothetical protein
MQQDAAPPAVTSNPLLAPSPSTQVHTTPAPSSTLHTRAATPLPSAPAPAATAQPSTEPLQASGDILATMPTHQHTASIHSVHSDDLRSLTGSRGLTTPSPAFDDSASASELGVGSTTAKKKRRKKKKRKKKVTNFKGVSAADEDDRVSDENGVSADAVPHLSFTSPNLLITFHPSMYSSAAVGSFAVLLFGCASTPQRYAQLQASAVRLRQRCARHQSPSAAPSVSSLSLCRPAWHQALHLQRRRACHPGSHYGTGEVVG